MREVGCLAWDSKDGNPKDMIASKKIPLWLLSPFAKAHWALGQFAGLCKYGAWNWRKSGVRTSVYLSAIQRHFDAYLSGEEHDPVDGTHHLGNIMACCAILLDAHAAGKLTDDRPPSVGIRGVYGHLEALMHSLALQYAEKSPKHYTIQDTELPAPPALDSTALDDEAERETYPLQQSEIYVDSPLDPPDFDPPVYGRKTFK